VVGTSWGDILVAKYSEETGREMTVSTALAAGSLRNDSPKDDAAAGTGSGSGSKGHLAAVNCMGFESASGTLFSGDDTGTVIQWQLPDMHPRSLFEGKGYPCTAVACSPRAGGIAICGFACGHVRIFGASMACTHPALPSHSLPGPQHMPVHMPALVEVAAHARPVTALALHPGLATFATVGEDSVLNVWSLGLAAVATPPAPHQLPDSAGGGAAAEAKADDAADGCLAPISKLLLDSSLFLGDCIPTGVQFVRRTGGLVRGGGRPDQAPAQAAPHLAVASYDSNYVSLFFGL
jgi:WD40 repeat protein